MGKLDRLRLSRQPLRIRLTFWYLLTLAAILVLFLTFLYWQVQRSLLAQMDATLRLAASQAVVGVEAEGGRLMFGETADFPNGQSALSRQLSDSLAIYLLGPEGAVWDWRGQRDEIAAQAPRPGLRTVIYVDDPWRVYTEPILLAGDTIGWIQVAQEMDPVTETMAGLRAQMLLGLPLALLLAGLGGSFLAWRALRPIERITSTAETINAGDLSRRIAYAGPADEVGRLAATFDSMLDRLQAAFERERRFTGDAAHELRTPLTAIKGRIDVTMSRPRSAEAYRETLQEMGGQVDRLIRLSNDLLFMARLDQANGRSLRRETVALDSLLPAVIEQVRPLAERKGVVVVDDVAPQTAVTGDLDLFIRLFLNLLDNAIKYTPSGGRVVVGAAAADGDVVVSVSDTGAGIPPAHLPHLFQRFYRVEGDRARYLQDDGHGGTGLGLAIAAEIVRVHGGRIDVASEVGAGTTFTVHLPQ